MGSIYNLELFCIKFLINIKLLVKGLSSVHLCDNSFVNKYVAKPWGGGGIAWGFPAMLSFI